MAGGRPSKYKDEYAEQARKICLLGATDENLANFFGVSEKTINTWKIKYPEFLQSLKEGKEIADAEIAESLFNRAKGYSHPDVHITNYQGEITITAITKHYPPDATSAIFWLKNRKKEEWRDRKEIDKTVRHYDERSMSDEELYRIATEGRSGVTKQADSKKVTH